MSNRTAEADKAIREAWANEQDLVRAGKGTRDWTPEQQNDILTRGKAYDDTGKAFEGHHMKSVEAFPEFQGHPGNIQFLSRREHMDAHSGSYLNPTNGYYDPETGETQLFGDEVYRACNIIILSAPVSWRDIFDQNNNPSVDGLVGINDPEGESVKEAILDDKSEKADAEPANAGIKDQCDDTNESADVSPACPESIVEQNKSGTIWDHIKSGLKTVGMKIWDNREVIIRTSARVAASFAQAYLESKLDDMIESDEISGDRNQTLEEKEIDEITERVNKDLSNNEKSPDADIDNSPVVERSSPREHIVPAGGQHYWKNGERIWIEKGPYKRGGRSTDEDTEE